MRQHVGHALSTAAGPEHPHPIASGRPTRTSRERRDDARLLTVTTRGAHMSEEAMTPDDSTAQPTPTEDRSAGRRNDLIIQRISQLLNSPHPETGTVLQGKEVTARAQQHGQSLSTSYVLGLRSAARGVPSVHVLQLLADIYGVNLNFFASQRSPDDFRADMKLQAVLDDHDARALLLRAADLTAPAKENLAAIIEDMLRETPDE